MHALRGQRIHAETCIAKPDVAVTNGIFRMLTGGVGCPRLGTLLAQLLQPQRAKLPKQAGVLRLQAAALAHRKAPWITENRDDRPISCGLGIPEPGIPPRLDQAVEFG